MVLSTNKWSLNVVLQSKTTGTKYLARCARTRAGARARCVGVFLWVRVSSRTAKDRWNIRYGAYMPHYYRTLCR